MFGIEPKDEKYCINCKNCRQKNPFYKSAYCKLLKEEKGAFDTCDNWEWKFKMET